MVQIINSTNPMFLFLFFWTTLQVLLLIKEIVIKKQNTTSSIYTSSFYNIKLTIDGEVNTFFLVYD